MSYIRWQSTKVRRSSKKRKNRMEKNWRLCQKVIELLRNLPWNWQRISCHFSFTLEQWTQRLTTLALFISVPSSDHSCNFRFCYFVFKIFNASSTQDCIRYSDTHRRRSLSSLLPECSFHVGIHESQPMSD